MTPIERMARALAGHFGPEFDNLPKDKAELRRVRRHSAVYGDNTQDDLRHAARAALEAIREPTPEMIEAYNAQDLPFVESGYHAMIDAMLAENLSISADQHREGE